MSNDVITQVFTPLAQEYTQTRGADIAQCSQGLWKVLTGFYQRLGLDAPQRLDMSQQNPSERLQQDGYKVLSVQYLQQHPEVGYTTAVSLLDAVSKILVGYSYLAPSAETVTASAEVRRQVGTDLHAPEIYVIYAYALFVADASERVAFIRRNVERLFADVVQQMQQHPWLMWEDRQVPQQPQLPNVPKKAEKSYAQEADVLAQLGVLSEGGSSVPQVETVPPFSSVLSVPNQSRVFVDGANQVLQSQLLKTQQVPPVVEDNTGNGSKMVFSPM